MIKYQELFSISDCNDNPNCLYVFGDNMQGYGKKGQATIRDCHNSIGIATKIAPSTKEGSYFSDTPFYSDIVLEEIIKVFTMFYRNSYTHLVLPTNGLGTGLARLDKRAPSLFARLNKVFYND